ncbi:MAG: hypothetical protein KDI88_12035, partial [Gammaproteobacteria bacterium]|nr:hypothetical protein [Gammaproteobacteria bacterium]
ALPPGNRSAALFANTTFVAYDPTSSSAEASNMEASLLSGGTRVTRFTGTDGVSVAAALAGHQALVIPDLSASPSGGLSSALGSPSRTTINDFVNDGGLLLTVLDSGGHAIDLLNQTFGFSITPATATSTSYNRDAAAAAGTGLTAAPATLPANNATRSVTVASLPALARPLYVNGDRTTTVAWMVPVGRGWVVQLGWDWFNATPVGTLDAGWNTVMRQLVVSRTMERDVALLVDNTFVEYVPGSAGAEASNMEQSLLNLGWNVDGFTGTAAATLATVLDSAAALVLPDLERAPATSFLDSLDSAARDVLSDYVNDGGVLVTCADGGQRAEQLLNTLFGFSLVRGIAASDYDLDAPAAVGTPFAGLSTSLASPNATRPVTVASLPPLARAVYRSNVDPMTDTAAVWFAPVGNGWVVHFGWDFFSAAPTGELDGGGIAALGAAVSLGRAEPPVTLLTSTLYVDYNPGATSAEASNLEALLQNHGHPVRRIDFIQASDFTAVLPGSAALVIPDLEKAALPSLVDSLDTQTRALLSDYVHGGGRLIVFGDAGDRAINLVNALFGYSLARGSVNPATYPLNGEVANGTPFASLPPSIPLLNASRTLLASSLPPQARAIYRSVADPVSDTAGVSAIPVGNGWVVFIAWDAFNAAPIGAIVDQTDAIVAGLSLTAL